MSVTAPPARDPTGRDTPLVTRLTIDDRRWQELVASRPEATAFHHPAWAALLNECYGHRPFVLALANADDTLAAGVPVLEARGLRGRRWASLPYTDACAPLGEQAYLAQLVASLDDERRAAGVDRAEVRALVEGPAAHHVARGVVHELALQGDPEAVRAGFTQNVRRGVGRAQREQVRVRQGSERGDLLDAFYALHLATRRRLGVPIQPRRFFELLWERMLEPGLGFVLVAESRERPAAAAVFLVWNRKLIYKFGASDPACWGVRPNHAIFWDAIRRGCELGCEVLDFGRSDLQQQGLREFKSGWGAVERPLVYTTLGAPPRPSSGRAERLLARVIRRSPLWVCRLFGERLYKYAA